MTSDSSRAIVPPGWEAASALTLSPGVLAGGVLRITGMTGSGPDGAMPEGAEAQCRAAFAKIEAVCRAAGLDLSHLVETTSYHVGLADHFDAVVAVRAEMLSEPYPAWTAVEVAALRRPGALLEISAVAHVPAPAPEAR